jgi:DNA-binding phage protein
MMEIKTRPYDVAETIGSSDEMAAYLKACIKEANGDASFLAKPLGVLLVLKAWQRSHARQACLAKASRKRFQVNEALALIPYLKLFPRLG